MTKEEQEFERDLNWKRIKAVTVGHFTLPIILSPPVRLD
jgi:hypothetical protein